MFFFEPASSETELNPATTHGINLSYGNGQWTGTVERDGADQRPEANGPGLPGQTGQGDPGMGRSGKSGNVAHLQVMI